MNYGICPTCGGAGRARERRPNGDTICVNGHKHPSVSFHTELTVAQKRRAEVKRTLQRDIDEARRLGNPIATVHVRDLQWILDNAFKD